MPALLRTTAPEPTVAPIPLSVAFDESIYNSPRVANIRTQLGITKAGYAQAYTLPNPSFFLLHDSAQLAKQVGALIPIESPWKIAFRVLLVKEQLKQTDLEIQKALWQLRSYTRRAYLDLVIAQETRNTLEELANLSRELQIVAKRRFQTGDVADMDVQRAELAALMAEADYNQSKRKVDQSRQCLSVVLGRNYDSPLEVQKLPAFELRVESNDLLPNFRTSAPSADELIQKALSKRLDLKVIAQAINVNIASLKNIRANTLPNVQVNAGYSYSGNPPIPSVATRGYFLGVTQELPLLNFQQGERAKNKAIDIQLKQQLAATRNVITEEVISAYQRMMAARERIGYFQTSILATSNVVAKMARRGYEVGQTDITTTMAAQQANVQTQIAYLDAVRNYQLAMTDLEQAVGEPL
ncbi:MAG: TolC family protein [Candidatus Obscuribacterales bacterium]|nr:TolC family protein [Candidatus Obscuribacterales bacterium]